MPEWNFEGEKLLATFSTLIALLLEMACKIAAGKNQEQALERGDRLRGLHSNLRSAPGFRRHVEVFREPWFEVC